MTDRIFEFTSALAVALTLLVLLTAIAHGGERIQCHAEPLGRDWHYRTKIPGFAGDVKADRCWYQGPAWKPRDELYWSAPLLAPLVNQDFENRWEGLSAR